jgi:hypothetical protein
MPLGLPISQHSEVATTTWWDRLWPLLVTAVLTLLIFWFVQLVLVPRVEVRKRREERWEQDVLELGHLLTFEASETTDRLRQELWWQSVIEYETGDFSATHREQLKREHDGLLREAIDSYRGTFGKAKWIAERVASIDRRSTDLLQLEVDVLGLRVNGLDNLAPMYRPDEPVATEDEVDAAAKAAREEVASVVKLVKQFASSPPPRPRSTLDRMLSRIRRFTKKHPKQLGIFLVVLGLALIAVALFA